MRFIYRVSSNNVRVFSSVITVNKSNDNFHSVRLPQTESLRTAVCRSVHDLCVNARPRVSLLFQSWKLFGKQNYDE